MQRKLFAVTLVNTICLVTPVKSAVVDPSTLNGKVLFGYQGWFDCPGSWGGGWSHWASGVPSGLTLKIDMYPDLSEFPKSDLCQAGTMTIGNNPAYLFSARNPNIVDAHFKWMQQYGLDGVLIQRFLTDIPGLKGSGDVTLKNIIAASAKYGRVIAIEYDVTGSNFATWDQDLQKDWQYLVDQLKITAQPNYLQHKGKPLVSVWGMGLNETRNPPTTADGALNLVKWFHSDAAVTYRASVMGGVPRSFRTLNGDARTDSAWLNVYKSMDAVQPWNVGRYGSLNDIKGTFKNNTVADQKWLSDAGVLYMPVIFPGFSWVNASGTGKANQIPRLGGNFIWQQAMAAKNAGVGAIKIAMFDEVNESTSMFKVVSKRNQAPDQGFWLTLDADSLVLPSDWYLRLAGEITKIQHGNQSVTDSIPIKPTDPISIKPLTFANKSAFKWSRSAQGIRFSGLGLAQELIVCDMRGHRLGTLPIRAGEAFWDFKNNSPFSSALGIYMIQTKGKSLGSGAETVNNIVIPLP